MPKYPKELFERSPAEAVHALGETLLEEARTARTRLEDPSDEEALHDFRVALRRLRSVMRAFRPYIDHTVSKKLRRRLRDLTRRTNSARDTEVQVQWVQARLEQLTPTERIGARWFQKQLADQRDEGYATALRFIERDFPKLDRRVRQRLESAALDPRVAGDRPVNFAVALEELIADHSATLTQQLEAVHGPEDEDAAHSARISAKRLRYLMELIERDVKAAKSGVGHLKALQDILGELHDAQVVSVDFTEACEQAAAAHARRLSTLGSGDERNERERRRIRRRNATPGMLALVRLCRDAHDERFHEFLDWREGTWPKLLRETERVLEALREHAPPDLEVERKYLLTKLPDAARTADAVEVDQGWLPGERLVERIRRMKTKDGERFYRTVKAGSGVTRIEIEEEASVEVFEQLWPLTNGRRVRKRRYYVPDGELTWEIDEFLDRELWLAEVELASPTIDVTIPTWLADSVEREVTGEPEYVNVNLAQ